jgi:hypothetical protein
VVDLRRKVRAFDQAESVGVALVIDVCRLDVLEEVAGQRDPTSRRRNVERDALQAFLDPLPIRSPVERLRVVLPENSRALEQEGVHVRDRHHRFRCAIAILMHFFGYSSYFLGNQFGRKNV